MKPDVDLTHGTFYADGGAREAYRWMRANEPVFRDRNGLAAASTYRHRSVINIIEANPPERPLLRVALPIKATL